MVSLNVDTHQLVPSVYLFLRILLVVHSHPSLNHNKLTII